VYTIFCVTPENLNNTSKDEEIKLLYSYIELDKIGINSPSICSYNDFNDRINELYKRHDLFGKAILWAAYMYNINPYKSIENKIPNELFFNIPVDIAHLKVFGCKALFYNNHKFNIFENNSKPGILLGYASVFFGYKILDISINSFITARDVYFFKIYTWYY